ncbi:MAG: Asd/ArgC dimerization domain-containing protein, partial [Fulvivirga sp.]|nr:Asd/ArgC dimerization domain-containing protein [Fulvivirga sp.]
RSTKIIDLSADFRLKSHAKYGKNNFIYGLTASNKLQIQKAQFIANPGCFATAIQQGLLPLADAKLLNDTIHIHAITGSTGAGQNLSNTSHFSWRNNNISVYKAFTHQHLGEICESLKTVQADFSQEVNFLPVRGDFTRGIFASIYCQNEMDEKSLIELYQDYYKDEPFTLISTDTIHLKQVVNTNNCIIQVQQINNKALITVAIDNLLRGAAGQAIQNMNLAFGIEETCGLKFKANYF